MSAFTVPVLFDCHVDVDNVRHHKLIRFEGYGAITVTIIQISFLLNLLCVWIHSHGYGFISFLSLLLHV